MNGHVLAELQVDNTIELSEGESATCTIINTDDVDNQLTLVKVVSNTQGGNNDASDWTLTASGDDGFSGTGTPNGDDTIATTRSKQRQIKRQYTHYLNQQFQDTLQVNGHVLAELQVDNTIELSEGEFATCTITNTDDVANQLTLVKQVVNANGGNNDASDWTLTASGDDGFSGTGTPNGDDTIATTRTKQRQIKRQYTHYLNQQFQDTLQVNGHVLAELQVDNTIELSEGESATCTITNTDDVDNQLTLVKVVSNTANGGNNDASDWDTNCIWR